MIVISDLTKVYGKNDSQFTALSNVSLTIPDKTTVSIIGKSGSGKSTLMHLMSGLDRPTSGSILVDDVNMYNMKQKTMDNFRSTQMSFIFQSFFIEANYSCYQNVMLPLEIARLARGKRRSIVMEALHAVDLDSKASQLAGKLSGGQKQRLAIARAIVNKPQILFADEPTGNLDTENSTIVLGLLRDLNRRTGQTILMITHNPEAASYGHRIVHMRDGRIVENQIQVL